MVVGCGDETTPDPSRASDAGSKIYNAKWLDLSSPLTPAQWLVSRNENELKPIGDPEVRRVADSLSSANARYRESERMIANRASQLSDMLAPLGIIESPIAILEDLTSIAGEVGQTEGFGAISQHYFNLRVARVERREALAVLTRHYGPRR
jgi:hypothetical protein